MIALSSSDRPSPIFKMMATSVKMVPECRTCNSSECSSWESLGTRETAWVQEELKNTPRSVQIWQQLSVFSQCIRTGRMDAAQFGIRPHRPGVIPFLEALQENVDSSRQSEKAAWASMSGSEEAGKDEAMTDAGEQKPGKDGKDENAMDET